MKLLPNQITDRWTCFTNPLRRQYWVMELMVDSVERIALSKHAYHLDNEKSVLNFLIYR